MQTKKQQILELRNLGYGYKKIAKQLNITVSSVRYHLNLKHDYKAKERARKHKRNLKIKFETLTEDEKNKIRFLNSMRSRRLNFLDVKNNKSGDRFTVKQMLDFLQDNSFCYLTGKKINLHELQSYHLDHIVARKNNGELTLNNMGLLLKNVNIAKNKLTLKEFIELCNDVAKFTKSKKFKNFLKNKNIKI